MLLLPLEGWGSGRRAGGSLWGGLSWGRLEGVLVVALSLAKAYLGQPQSPWAVRANQKGQSRQEHPLPYCSPRPPAWVGARVLVGLPTLGAGVGGELVCPPHSVCSPVVPFQASGGKKLAAPKASVSVANSREHKMGGAVLGRGIWVCLLPFPPITGTASCYYKAPSAPSSWPQLWGGGRLDPADACAPWQV